MQYPDGDANITENPYGFLIPSFVPSLSPTTHKGSDMGMPLWIQLLWTAVFTVMVIAAVGGNCIVMWIVIGSGSLMRPIHSVVLPDEHQQGRNWAWDPKRLTRADGLINKYIGFTIVSSGAAHKRMRTVTNYFLVNLSTADLLLSTLNCLFNFIYMLQGNWRFGTWYCTINNFIAYATVAASVFTLTGISCDRYLAIVHPLHPRMSQTYSLVAICFIWIASMMCAFPCLLYSKTISYRSLGMVRTVCILVWPDGRPPDSQMDFAYQVMFLVLTYAVPMLLMTICYTLMGRVLWGAQSIGEMNQRQMDSIKSKRKVVRMFILIVLIFALCWLPYHGYFIYTHYDSDILYSKYVQHLYLGFYWFAMSNAMVNPLIYYWMNARFRKYFRTALCGWTHLLKARAGNEESKKIVRGNTLSFSKWGAHEKDKDPETVCEMNSIRRRSPDPHSPPTRTTSLNYSNNAHFSIRRLRTSLRRHHFTNTSHL